MNKTYIAITQRVCVTGYIKKRIPLQFQRQISNHPHHLFICPRFHNPQSTFEDIIYSSNTHLLSFSFPPGIVLDLVVQIERKNFPSGSPSKNSLSLNKFKKREKYAQKSEWTNTFFNIQVSS